MSTRYNGVIPSVIKKKTKGVSGLLSKQLKRALFVKNDNLAPFKHCDIFEFVYGAAIQKRHLKKVLTTKRLPGF